MVPRVGCLVAASSVLAALVAAGPAQPTAAGPSGVIAFVDDAGGDEEIVVMNADGSNRRRLTDNNRLDTEPAVSPDGTRVAWAGEAVAGNVDILVMNIDGTGVRRLTRHEQPDSDPTFSPDGATIAFRSDRRAGAAEIWLLNLDGTGLRRLTDAGPEERQSFQPSFGPDGRIAFTSDRDLSLPVGTRNEIFLMNRDGTGQRRVTRNAVNDSVPSFSPRGDRIAFWSNAAASNIDIWTISPDGAGRKRLTTHDANDLEPAFSPDGAWIAFASTRDRGNHAVYLMRADGSGQRRLAGGRLPSWGGVPPR